MNNYQILKDAIRTKQSISCIYHNHFREMSPHALGTKNGYEQALFFQFGGTSSKSGDITPLNADWRCFKVNEISELKIIGPVWHTKDNHSAKQTCIDIIDIEVDY